MQRRAWLFGGLALVLLCMLCCVLVFVAGLPRLRDGFEEGVREAVGTEVAKQIPAQAGVYTISAASLQTSLRENANEENADDLIVEITVQGIEVGISASSQRATYSGRPAANNGRFELQDTDTNSSILGFFLSAGDFRDAVEDAINTYLHENRLRLEAIELNEGAMTLHVVSE